MAGNPVIVEGAGETIAALEEVAKGIAPGGVGVETAGGIVAEELAALLRISAASSGVPVAPRVARSVKVRRGKTPSVSVGDGTPVGARGAPAYQLVWGSEHGPAAGAETNHFAVPAGGAYWIKPAVDRAQQTAPSTYELAVAGTIKRYGL